MTLAQSRMDASLGTRAKSGLLRELRVPDLDSADFSSNDYLGFSRSKALRESIVEAIDQEDLPTGATGSRLLSGHSTQAADVEAMAAKFHRAPAALLFNSGYDANLSLFSTLPRENDAIVYDALIHASVHDGMRLGRVGDCRFQFAHNSPDSLRCVVRDLARDRKLRAHLGFVVWVAIESVYSMDGDVAPLADILQIASELSTPDMPVMLIVDEAHAVGLNGPNGEGCCVEQNVQNHPNLFARVVTYGKAFGAHGATVLGNQLLRQYLINFARPLIYSTALPPHSVITLRSVYSFCSTNEAKTARSILSKRRELFRTLASSLLPSGALFAAGSRSPIQSVLVPGNDKCVAVAQRLRNAQLDVYPIRTPTVPKGTERIRVIIHAHNTDNEIIKLVNELASALNREDVNLKPSQRAKL